MADLLEIGDLRAFLATVRAGSITRAALALGLTQPAVSQRLQRLERSLGAQLVERRARGTGLSTDGEALLSYAERIVILHDEAFAACRARAAEQEQSGLRTVAILEDLAVVTLPGVLADFAALNPRVDLDIIIDSAAALSERAETGLLDMTVGDSSVMPRSAVRWRTSLQPAWTCIPAFDIGQDPLPLVMFAPPCNWRQQALDTLARQGRTWRIAFQSSSLAAIQAAISAGIGTGPLFPLNMPAGCMHADPAVLPSPPAVELVIARMPGRETDTALNTLESLLRRAIAQNPRQAGEITRTSPAAAADKGLEPSDG
jgi:DNA-binding transcriptional LysR family regulator